MPKQSTRHRYRTRREKNARAARTARLLFWFGLAFLLLLLVKNWREYWAWLKTFGYD